MTKRTIVLQFIAFYLIGAALTYYRLRKTKGIPAVDINPYTLVLSWPLELYESFQKPKV